MEPDSITDSWMITLGGQGNATGWSLAATTPRLVVPDVSFGHAARTTLLVTWGDEPAPLHIVAGPAVLEPAGSVDLGALEVGDDGARLEHPAGTWRLRGVPAGRYRVWFRAHAVDADGGTEDRFSAVVTLWLHLAAPDRSFPPSPRRDGSALNTRLNELGFVLCDAPVLDRLLRERHDVVTARGGILEAITTTTLAEELLDTGGFLPVWGMRPWVYRLATPGAGPTSCPLGHRVGGPLALHAPGFASGAYVVPGSALRGVDTLDWSRWPLLPIPGAGPTLRVETFVTGGIEPLDPTERVGVLATIWLSRSPTPTAAPNSLGYSLTACDPLPAYSAHAEVDERATRRPGADGASRPAPPGAPN